MLLFLACSTAEPDDGVIDRTITLDPPHSGYQIVTDPVVVEPFSEVEICSVVQLPPDADEVLVWADRMETLVSPGTHHMNVFMGQFTFLDPFMGDGAAERALGAEIGQMPCSELAVMESAFPVFPSQRDNQEITFPEGVAAPLMLPSLFIFSHHYVNTGPDPIRINAALNVETVPRESVDEVAALIFDSIGGLDIPPGEAQVVHRTCVMERDVNVALVSTHTHEWGECASLNDYDGQDVAPDPFFVNHDWELPPILHFEPYSFTLEAGQGIHYACHFDNTTDRTLTDDGTAQGEMCVFAAVVHPAAWTVDQVEETVAGGDLAGLLELMDEALGPCDSQIEVASPWDDGDTCEGYDQTESNTLD